MNSMGRFIQNVEPFTQLPAAELERLSDQCRLVRHTKGEVLFTEGEKADSMWVLQKGRLEIFKYNAEGRALAIESIEPGHLFGTLCRLGVPMMPAYPCTAVAAMDSVSVRIPDRVFKALGKKYPAMVLSACQLCSVRLRELQQRVITYQEPVPTRILQTLFQFRDAHGDVIFCTKREIAELSATTVETTIRLLSHFEKEGWIVTERGKITLVDVPHLQSLLKAKPEFQTVAV